MSDETIAALARIAAASAAITHAAAALREPMPARISAEMTGLGTFLVILAQRLAKARDKLLEAPDEPR